MRVVHFCRSFSPLSETFIYDYVTELEHQGVDNYILTHRRLNKESRPFSRVRVVPKPSRWNPRRLWHRFLVEVGINELSSHTWSLMRPRLADAICRIRPNVIHAHFGQQGVQVAPIAEQLGIPLVVTFYGVDISKLPREAFWRARYQELWKIAGAVTVLSEEMRRAALELGCPEDKVHVVHLSRDLSKFLYHPPSGAVENFVSVGRLTEKKGHRDMLEAFHQAVQEGNVTFRLRIIGEGHLREELAAYIAANNLGQHVTLVGAISNDEVAEELQAADAFILCSKTAPNGDREGTPTVLIEAQAVGLPCISTRHAGIPELIPDKNHWLLAEEGDVTRLAVHIQRLAESTLAERDAIAERGRAWVESAFNLEHEASKLQMLYAGIATDSVV